MATLKLMRRLPASSLLEVTVATAILVLVFGLALGSLARLTLTGPRQLELRGRQLVAHYAAETSRQRAWHARSWEEEGLVIEQEVIPSPTIPHLLTLRLTASAHGQQVTQLQQLVYDTPTTPTP
jgi:hypothetical protein